MIGADCSCGQSHDPVAAAPGLVDTSTTSTLLKLIEGGQLDPTVFATHHFALADTEEAYDVFAAAAETHALKVVLQAVPVGFEPVELERHTAQAGV